MLNHVNSCVLCVCAYYLISDYLLLLIWALRCSLHNTPNKEKKKKEFSIFGAFAIRGSAILLQMCSILVPGYCLSQSLCIYRCIYSIRLFFFFGGGGCYFCFYTRREWKRTTICLFWLNYYLNDNKFYFIGSS